MIDSANQAVRRMEIWVVGSGARARFRSCGTSWFGRKGVSSSTSRLSSNLVRDIDYDVQMPIATSITLPLMAVYDILLVGGVTPSLRKNWICYLQKKSSRSLRKSALGTASWVFQSGSGNSQWSRSDIWRCYCTYERVLAVRVQNLTLTGSESKLVAVSYDL